MADKFDVYNGSEAVSHTEGTADSDGYTPITVSSLAPATEYDGFKVAHAGEDISKATALPSFTTSAIPVTGVTLDSDNPTSVAVGADITLAAAVAPSNATNQNITWSSSDDTVAAFTKTGAPTGSKILTGVKAGTVTVTVTTEDGSKKATADIEVTAAG